ncbi:pyridoxal-phosphate dependent enzyme [Thermococcus sp. GR7]|uniref:pyridoxal-phosphate dependent enzyme n=1 Tax=unclassified Thermococcus TaxID=2627626 RepID=UPI0014319807|nr:MULTISPECIES: pyridoxal-phosphate dependent enzyme [unclassified Thermococcus]NJE47008.1 pyridoxal-phosphate dependent enzyme [Thermococcus sp. GR7]NJE78167.1 pyridoxal-phosphate dependent enzyme [Thermococcus sp. GR4]NJF22716.1 pyridoxal-phosphate dependent enzyme [Thermococcus sp. GR5]
MFVRCPSCGRLYSSLIPPTCSCGEPLRIAYDYENVDVSRWGNRKKGVWRYRELLPDVNEIVSLHEGGTPLLRAKLGEELGLNVFIKDETRNPTGSFRDRLITVAVSYGLPHAENGFVVASNGNAAASLAAYAARAGKEAYTVVPKLIEKCKLTQIVAFGAKIIRYGESVDEGISYAEGLAEGRGLYNITPESNLIGLEGQKTVAFELWEELNPTHVIVPTGSGSNLYSIYKGFRELLEIGVIEEMPKLIAVQTERCSPIASEVLGVEPKAEPTKALALYVKNPLTKELALEAIRETDGTAVLVGEDELDLGERLLAKEGIFAEYASVVIVPALLKLAEEDYFERDDRIALIVTSSGLKGHYSEGREKFTLGGTKLEILKLLSERSMYGYEIWEALEKPLKYQAVYQHLRELESLGLIEESHKKGRRVYYGLTEKGRKFLETLSA